MSVEAITWALRQPISHSSAKFVLVVLANCASADTALAYPSVAYLAQATGQDRKTVTLNLGRLIEWGLIEDTGKRKGATGQIIVYKLHAIPDLFAPKDEEKRNSSENGTVPKTDGKSTVFPHKDPQKRNTEPSLTVRNRQSRAQRSAQRFSEFFEIYPKQVKRKPCLDLWKAKDLDQRADELIADVKNRKAHDRKWLEGYPPDPLTYLTQERWHDQVEPSRDAPAPAAAPASARVEETPLECELRWIRNRYDRGEFGEGDAALATARKLSDEATAKHRAREAEKA